MGGRVGRTLFIKIYSLEISPVPVENCIVEAIKYVDKVIPENSWEQKVDDIKKYNVDVFVMGDDWRGKFDDLKEYCEVVYLPRTEGISTTQIKDELKYEVQKLSDEGKNACLAVVQVGNDPASSVYVNNKKKACAYIGIRSKAYELPEETTEAEKIS